MAFRVKRKYFHGTMDRWIVARRAFPSNPSSLEDSRLVRSLVVLTQKVSLQNRKSSHGPCLLVVIRFQCCTDDGWILDSKSNIDGLFTLPMFDSVRSEVGFGVLVWSFFFFLAVEFCWVVESNVALRFSVVDFLLFVTTSNSNSLFWVKMMVSWFNSNTF